MSRVAGIDVRHLGLEGAIACYLVDGPEPALVDPGPSTALGGLLDGLRQAGVSVDDVGVIVLTHIHLDHAGAVGHLLERWPHLRVFVHEEGAPHLVDPARLVASTRRTFGEAHDRLWGEVKPVAADRIDVWRPGGRARPGGLRPIPTPGHIRHHLAYLDEDEGTLLSGDSMGIVLREGAPVHPPTPPPAVDLEAWRRTLSELAGVGAERFGATHFGLHADVPERLGELRRALDALEERVALALAAGDEEDAERFDREVREALASYLGRERADAYFETFSAAMDWAGVRFYLERRSGGR